MEVSEMESGSKRTRFSYSSSSSSSSESGVNEEFVQKVIEERRKWSYTNYGLKYLTCPQQGLDFTVMTYNILSQQNLELNEYLYDHCDDKILGWNYRVEKLLVEVQSYNCDIICLQEIEKSHYEEAFNPFLENIGYQGLFKKKTGNQNDGCAIFFKKTCFSLELQFPVPFKNNKVPVLDRDNVGLIAILKPKIRDVSDKKLVVATTHLLYNPRRGDVKLSQLRVFLAEVDRLAFKDYSKNCRPQYHPVILCGDMNSEPFSPLYNFITCGSIFYKDMKSGSVSGQREGRNRGRNMATDELDLLNHLGINRYSKYDKMDTSRQKRLLFHEEEESPGAAVVGSVSESSGENCKKTDTVSDGGSTCDKIEQDTQESHNEERKNVKGIKLDFFCHHLNVLSAYTHYKGNDVKEVTIHNTGTCCTVDYIFYSVSNKHSFVLNGNPQHKGITEGPLKLLGNYDLLTEQDLRDIGGLPNAYLSSDHLCLVSRFLLTS